MHGGLAPRVRIWSGPNQMTELRRKKSFKPVAPPTRLVKRGEPEQIYKFIWLPVLRAIRLEKRALAAGGAESYSHACCVG
jgi:hypothetical protein